MEKETGGGRREGREREGRVMGRKREGEKERERE